MGGGLTSLTLSAPESVATVLLDVMLTERIARRSAIDSSGLPRAAVDLHATVLGAARPPRVFERNVFRLVRREE